MSEDFTPADATKAAEALRAAEAAGTPGHAAPGTGTGKTEPAEPAGSAAPTTESASTAEPPTTASAAWVAPASPAWATDPTTGPAGPDGPTGSAADTARAERGRKGRIVFFVFMALLMQLAFALSYTGAMHAPQRPHRMAVGVVAPAAIAQEVQKAFDSQGPLFSIKTEASMDAAMKAVKNHSVYGAYAPGAAGEDTLLVTTAGGPPAARAVYMAFNQVAQAQQHTLAVQDVVPAHRGDAEGLVPFYLVISWTVGGYLASTLVGLMGGMNSRTPRLAGERIALLAGYSILGGLGGTLIVHTILGFLGGNWWLQALIGTLIVFCVSVFANGLQSVLGLVGTGIVIGLFVILGNPSGAGPWPREMMPAFWRTIGPWLPNYQGTNAVRGVAYYGSHGLATALWVFAAYAVIGIVLSLAFAGRDNPVLRLSEH